VLAILFNESDAETYARAISEADPPRMSAASFVEAAVVVEAQTEENGSRQFDDFSGAPESSLNRSRTRRMPLAKVTGVPLLSKGNAFRKTDVKAVV
jgi:uncharacterized protein with PIN domain